MRHTMPLVLMLVLAGCTQPGAGDRSTSLATAESTRAEPVVATSSAAPGTGGRAADTGATLALEGEGLRVFGVPSGSARAIPFGTGKAEALDRLTAVQGAPPSDQGENFECDLTSATWPDGLTVTFAGDRFVGWSVNRAGSPLSTAAGLKVGSTRTEVEQGATVAIIEPSSLGEEFTAGNVAGLLASTAPDARVTDLWAGQVCIAR